MCIDIVEAWFGVANGQILSIFDRLICSKHDSDGVLSFHVLLFISSSLYKYVLNKRGHFEVSNHFFNNPCFMPVHY